MGKHRKFNGKDNTTRILYKKSTHTLQSHSKTCSGISQLLSRSAVLQIKNNLQEISSYYAEGGKIRRDLSLETDVCVLRRYYKNKRYRTSTYDSSAKSRYSTVIDTEVETIEEDPDASACGDNEQGVAIYNPTLGVATLMIKNLKDLLGKWFQKHLVADDKNREKIDTVFNTLLSELEQVSQGSSSYTTYILHRGTCDKHVKDKKINTNSFISPYQQSDESSGDVVHDESSSIPFPYNDVRMISTLSIPRSYNRRSIKKRRKGSLSKLRNKKNKDIILSKFFQSSTFDLLDFSQTSRCGECDVKPKSKRARMSFQHVALSNRPSTDGPQDNTSNEMKRDFNDIPNLLQSLCVVDPTFICTDQDLLNEIHHQGLFILNKSVTALSKDSIHINNLEAGDENYSDIVKKAQRAENHMYTIGYMNNDMEFPHLSKPQEFYNTKPRNKKTYVSKVKNLHRARYCIKRRSKFSDKYITSKQFTFLYKKANSHMAQGKYFLKHCQSIFDYFVKYEGNRNIKLDIQVNVNPLYDDPILVTKKDACTVTSRPLQSINDVKRGPTLIFNLEPNNNVPIMNQESRIDPSSLTSPNNADLITLLDGAASQSKYFGSIKNTKSSAANVDQSTGTCELDVARDINELRSIIKDLVLAAEKLVKEHLKRESTKFRAGTSVHAGTSVSQTSCNLSSMSKWVAPLKLKNHSKSIQCSYAIENHRIQESAIRQTDEGKIKDIVEFTNRLTKKSTSYRIIDSESILRVTDMTSDCGLNGLELADESLTSSVPKSRSLFEITTKRHKRKVLAFFCDGTCVPVVDKYALGYDVRSNTCTKKWPSDDTNEVKPKGGSGPSHKCNHQCCVPTSQDTDFIISISDSRDSAVETDPEVNKVVMHRRGMSFIEGSFYCLMLWIPVIIIASLFYIYVLKYLFYPKKDLRGRLIRMKASDFGF